VNNTITPQSGYFYLNASLDVETMPGHLHEIIELLAKTYSVDKKLISVALDAAFAIAGQASFEVQRPSDSITIPIGDFFLIAAESGSKKDAINSICMKPIEEMQNEWFKSDLSADKAQSLVLVHVQTTEGIRNLLSKGNPSLGLVTGELIVFLGGYSMKPEQRANTLGSMSRWWDGNADNFVTAGKGVCRTLISPRVSSLMWGQPELVAKFMHDKDATHQGLLNRFLPHQAPEFKPSQLTHVDINKEPAYLNYCEVVKQLLSFFDAKNCSPDRPYARYMIPPSKDAAKRWEDFHCECQEEAAEDYDFTSYLVRLPEHALRAAARQRLMQPINSNCSADSLMIDVESMERAIRRVKAHACAARPLILEGDFKSVKEENERLYQWLKDKLNTSPKCFNDSLIANHYPSRRLRGSSKKERRLRLINELIQQGRVEVQKKGNHSMYELMI